MAKLSGKIDAIIDDLLAGETFRAIAKKNKISLSALHEYLNKAEHSARVREALQISADSYSDKAEQVLLDAKSNLIEISRARELAQHYRWKASKRNPGKFGDKLDVTTGGKSLGKDLADELYT